ncbi:MAG: hypothetical protein VX112_00500 [Pseudomonadota bacterium]|nr:hypothetical protein [Pseudomonadota bacterium]
MPKFLTHLIVLEVSHHNTPLAARENLCWSQQEAANNMQQLMNLKWVESVMTLVTCNRTACICVCYDHHQLRVWWARLLGDKDSYTTTHTGQDALSYLLRMSVGLESMLIGEHHILGQLRRAFLFAVELGCCRGEMNFLLEQILCHAKQIRHESQFGQADISLAQLAYEHVQKILPAGQLCRVVFLGSGKVVQQHLRVFSQNPFLRLGMVCRDKEKCAPLACVYDLDVFSYAALAQACDTADVVIAATSCPDILWRPSSSNLQLRLCMDWSVPRNIGFVPNMQHVEWVSIDDVKKLRTCCDNTRHNQSIARAGVKVLHAQHRALEEMRLRDVGNVLGDFRRKVQHAQEQHLRIALSQLDHGTDPPQVLRTSLRDLHKTLLDFFLQVFNSDTSFPNTWRLCHQVESKAIQGLRQGRDPVVVLQRALHQATAKISHLPTQYLRRSQKQCSGVV